MYLLWRWPRHEEEEEEELDDVSDDRPECIGGAGTAGECSTEECTPHVYSLDGSLDDSLDDSLDGSPDDSPDGTGKDRSGTRAGVGREETPGRSTSEDCNRGPSGGTQTWVCTLLEADDDDEEVEDHDKEPHDTEEGLEECDDGDKDPLYTVEVDGEDADDSEKEEEDVASHILRTALHCICSWECAQTRDSPRHGDDGGVCRDVGGGGGGQVRPGWDRDHRRRTLGSQHCPLRELELELEQ